MSDPRPRGRSVESLEAAKHDYVPNRGHGQGDQKEFGNRCLDCGKPELDPVHNASENLKERMVEEAKKLVSEGEAKSQWAGATPFFLVFERGPSDNVGIDVDVSGWIEANKELFRAPGVWLLMHKQTMRPVMSLVMAEGEQFYWTKHHVGNLMAGAEVITYGMGKKRTDGNTVNLWLLPNGMTVGGSEGEADLLASRMIGPAKAEPKP